MKQHFQHHQPTSNITVSDNQRGGKEKIIIVSRIKNKEGRKNGNDKEILAQGRFEVLEP